MTLRIYDTAARAVRDFTPLIPGQVGIYLCGATVQSAPHIGHMRSAVAFDVISRWLSRSGYDVTLIRNVTDIDDKILAKAAEANRPWWAWAYLNEQLFTAAYDALGVSRPTYEPRATGHISDMIALMRRLVDHGHAYVAGPGDVYFDTRSWSQYGSLTNQRPDDLGASADTEDGSAKRDPRDFALWKAPKPGEPQTAQWDTPFGAGRPGWHLECSAMAHRYLGSAFDIHGGGLDLRFPHHENEAAQSRAAGDDFAQYWMHSAWVTQSGAKMSKSLGNGLLVSEVLAAHQPAVLRLALAGVHYRSMIEWAPETIREAEANWEKFRGFVERATERVGGIEVAELADVALVPAAVDAFNDDFNIPVVMAVVHELVRDGNVALTAGDEHEVRRHLVQVRAILDVLGLDPASSQWAVSSNQGTDAALGALVQAQLDARAAARAAKDFATADSIRDLLQAAGITVEDGPDGARWSMAQRNRGDE
ncbi:cysteinyl-tRNA synthetase [Micrococcales bacterium KH10]|nr:cysteinyl-tRNA synthetase [Micrococcales bacterium KH10]